MVTFVKQPCKQRGKHQENCKYPYNLPLMLLPSTRCAELHLAARRETALANAPPLQQPPVIDGCRKRAAGSVYVPCLFATEDANGSIGRQPGEIRHRVHWTAHDL